MKFIRTGDKGFSSFLSSLLRRGESDTSAVEASVRKILSDVRRGGDKAVERYTRKFDGVTLKGRLFVSASEINSAMRRLGRGEVKLLESAARRIEDYHRRSLQRSWTYRDSYGSILGVKVTPVERAGIYVPGGKAAYPSTVLMNAVPAKVAGVAEVIMATPPSPPSKDGINPYVLAAARVAGVTRILRAGGAQAVGALAYGTESVPKVDKITGPGNIYVATAKRLVFGTVDIDMIAGPSEILIINDGGGDPAWIAADLLSQAEHDELASSILVTTSLRMADAVRAEVRRQLKGLKRREIAAASMRRYGAVIVAGTLKEAAEISNSIAPEHLELFVDKPFALLKRIRNAGAVFLGRNTPEAVGDYIAGPNHTLPTGGTARFSSPLSVEDFMKRSSVIGFSRRGIEALGKSAATLANLEGLNAHAKSVEERLKGE